MTDPNDTGRTVGLGDGAGMGANGGAGVAGWFQDGGALAISAAAAQQNQTTPSYVQAFQNLWNNTLTSAPAGTVNLKPFAGQTSTLPTDGGWDTATSSAVSATLAPSSSGGGGGTTQTCPAGYTWNGNGCVPNSPGGGAVTAPSSGLPVWARWLIGLLVAGGLVWLGYFFWKRSKRGGGRSLSSREPKRLTGPRRTAKKPTSKKAGKKSKKRATKKR